MEYTVVLPAYNVEKTLEKMVELIERNLRKITRSYEIIIVEDGSNDRTYEVAKHLARKNKIRLIHSKSRLGKGGALKKGFRNAKGKYIIFMDADILSTTKSLPDLISSLHEFDIVIGSRYHYKSKTKRSMKRYILSKIYNFLIRIFFPIGIKDFQCGFKGFDRKVLPIALSVHSNDYFWDTEFLVKSYKKFKIKEIPIYWHETDSSVSLIKVPFSFFLSLVKLRLGLQ
jgi:hypothetical protein